MEDTKVSETVGQRILAARNEQGMRQIDLAELVQVSDRSIQAYENDEVTPYRKMQELADILGVSVAWLLHGDEADKTPGDEVTKLLEAILERLDSIADGKKPARTARPRTTTARPKSSAKKTGKTKTSRKRS